MKKARIDENQPDVVAELRRCGVSVHVTSGLGGGFPDIVAAYPGKGNYLFEIKNPAKPPSQRNLTPAEQKFFESWPGPRYVIETAEDALQLMGLME